jgi:ribosome-associated protein
MTLFNGLSFNLALRCCAMRGRDTDTGDFLGPSRAQQRREALDVLAMVQTLGELSDSALRRLPLPDHLLAHFAELRRINAHGARKRQHAYIAKQMRGEEDETLEAIRDALAAGGEAARQETALLHRAEAWRERLLDDGDAALAELLDGHPQADRQQLRQLVRNALDERTRNKPPRAFRELFRVLRELLAADMPADDTVSTS